MRGQEREARVRRLIRAAHELIDQAVSEHIVGDGREHAATVILFSGGNDSTVLAHMMRGRATHAAHANTGIGIEETRQFVRDTCREWGLPLLERKAPRDEDSYRAHVLEYGFPGPAMHWKMYQRLKERALEQVRRELVTNGRRQRIVFLAGRRRDESQRRASIPEVERTGSIVWVSPIANWTKADLNAYRLMHRTSDPVPVNRVSGLLHMSGECLCGAFAKPAERAEIAYWFPETEQMIADLEAEIADRDDIPASRKTWGWGADPGAAAVADAVAAGQLTLDDLTPSASGPLCSSCAVRQEGAS